MTLASKQRFHHKKRNIFVINNNTFISPTHTNVTSLLARNVIIGHKLMISDASFPPQNCATSASGVAEKVQDRGLERDGVLSEPGGGEV